MVQLVNKYIKFRWRTQQMKAFCRLRMLVSRYSLLKFNQRRLMIFGMWS
jgi:hypothetical protein